MKSWMKKCMLAAALMGLAVAEPRRGDTRSIGVKTSNNGISIRSVAMEGSEDVIGFDFGTTPLPRWVVSYFSKDGEDTAVTRSRWSLWKLLEYNESGADQGFQPGADSIVNQYRFWTSKWSGMEVTKSQSGDATVYSFCTETTSRGKSPSLPFVLRLCNFVTDKPADVNGTDASPNSLKWSLEIDGYPYANPNTHLALKVAFDSLTNVKPAEDGAEDTLQVSADGEVSTAVSWVPTVDLVGGECPASANVTRATIYDGSVPGDTDNDAPRGKDSQWTRDVQITYFSFLTDCQPEKIIWDPEFGVVGSTSAANMATVSFFMIAFALLFTLL